MGGRWQGATGVGVLLAVTILAGCGDDGGSSSNAAGGKPEAETETGTEATAAAPSLPDPSPALECDGEVVLCVDVSAEAAGDGTAEAPFAAIADAVGAAGPGATIQVAAGTYDEAVVLDGAEDLALIGGFPSGGDFSERDPEANETVLQGNEEAAVIDLVGSTGIRVEGLHLTGGGGYNDGYSRYGGGIYIDQTSSEVAVVANVIDANAVDRGDDPTATFGGGIASYGTGVEIVGNVVEGNRAGRGSGIAGVGEMTVEANLVRDNVSVGDHGGGIYLAGDVTVTANQVEGNSVGVDYAWGGGIMVYGDDTTATLQGNIVTDNLALSQGSGVFVDDGADATLVGELYYANQCSFDGGNGLLIDSGGETATVVHATNLTIAQHDCPDSALGGNAILASVSVPGDPPPEVTISNSIFGGNAGSDLLTAGAAVEVTYSLAEEAIEGDGNISGDPGFVDPASGDFSLDPASPAVGAGDGGGDLGHTGAAGSS